MSKVKNKFCEDHFFFWGDQKKHTSIKKKNTGAERKEGSKEGNKEGRKAGRKEGVKE